MSKTLSVIVPCYNEEESLPLFYDAICKAGKELCELTLELLFVDDGSKDGTLRILRDLKQKDTRVKYLSFSRNFGKEAALLAGLTESTGELVTVMDADLQDPPALLREMVDGIEKEGYDIVATRRSTRAGEPPVRSAFAHLFYRLMNRVSDADMMDGARDFRMMRRCVVDAILSLPESHRFSKGIFGWVGFRTKWLDYENVQRAAGQTKWSFWKLFKYSLEGVTSFTSMPLLLPFVFGGLALFAAFVTLLTTLFTAWAGGLVTLILLLGGVQLMCIGVVGMYLGKAGDEVRGRPKYIVRERG